MVNIQRELCVAILLGVLLLGLPGCGWRKKRTEQVAPAYTQTYTDIDIPVGQEEIRSFFDENINEFEMAQDTFSVQPASVADASTVDVADDFSWTDASIKEDTFKVIYFDFDKKSIRPDQEPLVVHDIERAKEMLEKDDKSIVLIEGHACHSSGSAMYNLALSEERAKILKERFIAQGVSPDRIKIVGRGQEVPALVNGKEVTGNREEQWPNRRDEVRIVYS